MKFHRATMEIKVPKGFKEHPNPLDWFREFRGQEDELIVIVGKTPAGWYLAIGHPDRVPAIDEMRALRFELIPAEVTMVILCPRKAEIDTLHPNLIHWHEARLVDAIYHVNK